MSFATVALPGYRAVPLEPVSFEGRENFFTGACLVPWWVDVLDPDEPLPRAAACLQVTGDSGKQ